MTEVATLKKAVSEAENKGAAEHIERGKQEAWVEEVQKELQALVKKHKSLEVDSKTRAFELAAALDSAKPAKAEAQKALQEIEAMKKIAAGKAFFMQSKHMKVNYLLLTRIRSSPGAFADFPSSVSDAAAFYRAEEGSSTEKVFWSQYAEVGHPVPLSDQLKQLLELHKVAEQAMKGLIVRLWPGEALPGSYFGLVRRLVDAYPRLEVIKRSVCIEGARRALALAKVHWGRMDAEKIVKDGPPQGKEYRRPEMYYEGVLKGARLVADECPMDVILE
ncbi:unnamed protein product [Triticum aestivum]|uniref:Uncharacterized protein n=1 Tax=Triticum aestivum TaxID=4565 RepID=A0A7H4LN81_WHEAT|nr:unnamed protein product [Triticum aestivum]